MVGHTISNPVVVLGFGAAAVSAVLALRDEGYYGPICVVNAAAPEPYSPVLTSYFAGGRIPRSQCNPWADIDLASAVDEMHAHTRPRTIDVAAHEITLDDGNRLRYSKLLVATGAHPVAPGFPHIDGYRPHMLRTMDDAVRLERSLRAGSCRRVLVSGTSMVGLKALEACLDRCMDVTLLGRSPHILRASAHPAVAERFELMLEERGVNLLLGRSACAAEYDEVSHTCAVSLDTGERERFDEIVLAQGVEANLDFMAPESLACDRGLIVDEFMRTSMPDVYAAGDVAQALDLTTGEHRIIGLWQNAVQQGRCAARAMAAELRGEKPERPYPGSIPSNVIHVQDLLFASAGSLKDEEGKHIELHDEDGVLSVFAYRALAGEERLVGFNVFSYAPSSGIDVALIDRIGRYRAEVRNSYLDIEGSDRQ